VNPPPPADTSPPPLDDDPLSSGPPDYDAELVKILLIAASVPAALLVLAGLGWLADWAHVLTTATP
jgi:hypothetical protein